MRRKIIYSLLLIIVCIFIMSLAWPFNFIYRRSRVERFSKEVGIEYLFLSSDNIVEQKFVAEDQRLKCIDVFLGEKTGNLSGDLWVSLKKNNGEVLCKKVLKLNKLNSYEFNKIVFRENLKKGKKYKLCFEVTPDSYISIGHIYDDNYLVNKKMYQSGKKIRGSLACNFVFSSQLDKKQTMAFWMVCLCVLMLAIALLSYDFRKMIISIVFSFNTKWQLLFICFFIMLFPFTALISSMFVTKHPVSVFNGCIVCLITIIFFVLFIKSIFIDIIKKTIARQFESSLFFALLICIIIRLPMLDVIPRWDAGEYYYRLGIACSNYDLSLIGFLDDFRLCGHSNLGFSFMMSFPEFLFPGNEIAMNSWNLILTTAFVYCLYWLFRKYWIKSTKWIAALGAVVVSSVPLFLGTFAYLNVDYCIVLVFIYMIYCDKRELNVLCMWNTVLLSQTKETGVVLVAGYWGLKLLKKCIIIASSKNSIRDKLKKLIKDKSLWIISFSGALYMVYVIYLGGFSEWTQNSTDKSSLGWSNSGFNCFGYNPEYILYKLKQFGIMNFAWVWLAIIVSLKIILMIRKIRKKSISDYSKIKMDGEVGAIIAYILFSCLYITYALPRYNIIIAVMIASVGVCFIVRCVGGKRNKKCGIILGCLLGIMVTQTFFNCDPVSRSVFKNVNIGYSKIIMSDYNNDYYGDALVTNYKYTWLDKAYDKLLNELKYRTGDIIMIPGQEWAGSFVGGNDASYHLYWDAQNKKRSFRNTGKILSRIIINDTDCVEGFMNKWFEGYYNNKRTSLIFYIPYYNTDIANDLKRFESGYYIGSEHNVNVYGGKMYGYRLIKKEEYQGLSVSDVLSANVVSTGKTNISRILEYMEMVGWSEDKVKDYACNLDRQQMRIIKSNEENDSIDVVNINDCIDVSLMIFDENNNQLPSFDTMQGNMLENLIVGSGQISKEAENALIGHKVGDNVVVEVEIPDYINDVRDLCGKKMRISMNIVKIKGSADISSLSEKKQLNNYLVAYDRIWNAYYKLACKKILTEGVCDNGNVDYGDIQAFKESVNRYFKNYRAVNQLSEQEYLEECLKISKDEYDIAIDRLALTKNIKKNIDKIANDYKESQMKKIENDSSLWYQFK